MPEWLVPFSIANAELLERIESALGLAAGDTFLDLACGAGGPGLWIAERTGASLIGVDFAPSAISAARALATERGMGDRAGFLVADATATGLPPASLRGVMSIDALMFVDAASAAREIARLLMPGGRFAMTAAESLVDPFTPTLVRDYRVPFEAAGLRTIEYEELVAHEARQRRLYSALEERSAALVAELGDAGEHLVEEARSGLARTTKRVRHVFFVAERV